jgi:hypothetical protein
MAPNIADDFLVQEHIELILQQARSILEKPGGSFADIASLPAYW